MCGAFTLHHSQAAVASRFLAEHLGAPAPEADLPRYKVSPSEQIDIVRAQPDGQRRLETAKWGLVPFWAKDPGIGRRTINARVEGIRTKPAFRNALAKRRCLIPADGFYEWDPATKQPMYFRRADGGLFAFAGLWEDWRDDRSGGAVLRTCTLLTTAANRTVGAVHYRMPVMLLPEAEACWLGENPDSAADDYAGVLGPYPDDLMVGYWVSKSVNTRGPHGPEAAIAAERMPAPG